MHKINKPSGTRMEDFALKIAEKTRNINSFVKGLLEPKSEGFKNSPYGKRFANYKINI